MQRISPKIQTTIERDLYEHEVLLEFLQDQEAEVFQDWWRAEGETAFNKYFQEWAKERTDDPNEGDIDD